MIGMDEVFLESFRRLLEQFSTPAAIRADEQLTGVPPLWRAIEESGYLDAMVPEDLGGAGLSVGDVFPLVALTGEYALPAPLAETLVTRALIGSRGAEVPRDAAIVIAPPSAVLPLGGAASHALVARGDVLVLITLGETHLDPFRVGGGEVHQQATPVLTIPAEGVDLLVVAAGLTAAKMAGAMTRLLFMSLRYANERQQFGRPLGKFQAIQHQLAIMAEQVVSAEVAARIGMSGTQFDPVRVAAAKARTSEASHQVCAIAHAVHGAIGVTEEYDLQLYTRRLKQWQLAFGTESYWARRLGVARLQEMHGNTADFIRLNLQDAQ